MKLKDARYMSASAQEALRYRVVNAIAHGMSKSEGEHVTFAMSTNAQRVRMIARESENSEDNSVEYHEST